MTDSNYIEIWLVTDMLRHDPSNSALQQKARDLLARLRCEKEILVTLRTRTRKE
jgi:hypothetical protein